MSRNVDEDNNDINAQSTSDCLGESDANLPAQPIWPSVRCIRVRSRGQQEPVSHNEIEVNNVINNQSMRGGLTGGVVNLPAQGSLPLVPGKTVVRSRH